MKKIKILDRSFNTTHFGYLEAGKVYEVTPGFAEYCVKNMKSAVYPKSKASAKPADKE